MSTKAVLNFVDTILQHFPPYRWEEEQQKSWVNTMVRELGSYDAAVLDEAVKDMVRTRKDRKIPLVSECLAACNEAKSWLDKEKNAGDLPIDGQGKMSNLDWTAERLKLATELCCTSLGKQAAKEGWIGALHSFARKNSRLPQPGKEIDGCKLAAREFDQSYVLCVRGDAGPASKALEKLGALMLEKRNRLIERVLHGVIA